MSNNENSRQKYISKYYINKKIIEVKNNIKEDNVLSYYKNKSQDKIKENYKKQYAENKCIETYKELMENDPIFRITNSMSTRVRTVLKECNISKDFEYNDLLSCTIRELKIYLETRFKDGMSYENYGEWEVDHIYPVSKFNLINKVEFNKCFNYKNLQPLWKTENRSKSNKIL